MIVKLLTEHHLEFLSLKRGCRGSYESSLVKMSNCWKSHALAQLYKFIIISCSCLYFISTKSVNWDGPLFISMSILICYHS